VLQQVIGSSDLSELNSILPNPLVIDKPIDVGKNDPFHTKCHSWHFTSLEVIETIENDLTTQLRLQVSASFPWCVGRAKDVKMTIEPTTVHADVTYDIHYVQKGVGNAQAPDYVGGVDCRANTIIGHVDFDCTKGGLDGVACDADWDIYQAGVNKGKRKEIKMADPICSMIKNTEPISQWLFGKRGALDKFLVPRTFPLKLESSIRQPSTMVDFKSKGVMAAVRNFVDEIVKKGNSRSGSSSIKVNEWIREHMLDGRDYFRFDGDVLGNDGVLVDDGRRFARTHVSVSEVEVFGLDSVSMVDEVQAIGSHTLQAQLGWKTLSLIFHIHLQMGKPDSNTFRLVDSVKVQVDLDNVRCDAAMLLAITSKKLHKVPLGMILHNQTRMECLAPTVDVINMSLLDISFDRVLKTPAIEYELFDGLDEITSNLVHAGVHMYNDALHEIFPGFADTNLKEAISKRLNTHLSENLNTCEGAENDLDLRYRSDDLVDLRQLLLGSDGMPYGTLVPTDVFPFVRKQLKDKFLLNSLLLAGTNGKIDLNPFELKEDNSDSHLFKSWSLEFNDMSFDNVDSASFADIEEPNSATSVSTVFQFNERSRQPAFSFNLKSIVTDEFSALAMNHSLDFDIKAHVKGNANFDVQLRAGDLHAMSLKEASSLICWASKAQPKMEQLNISFSDLTFQSECLTCSHSVKNALAGILDKTNNFRLLYEDSFSLLVADLLLKLHDGSDRDAVSPYLSNACQQGETDAVKAYLAAFSGFPAWSSLEQASIESIVGFGLVALHAGGIIASKNALDQYNRDVLREAVILPVYSNQPTNFNSIDFLRLVEEKDTVREALEWTRQHLEEKVRVETEVVVDYNNFFNQTNSSSNATEAPVEQLAPSTTSTLTLQINNLLRKYNVTNERGEMVINIDGSNSSSIALRRVKVLGLDAVTELDSLQVTGPQHIRNEIKFDALTLILDFEIQSNRESGSPMMMQAAYSLPHVEGEVEFLLDFDNSRLNEVRIGSLFNTDNLPQCLSEGLHRVGITELSLRTTNIPSPILTHNFSSSSMDWTEEMMDNFLTENQVMLREAFPHLLNGAVRDTLNGLVADEAVRMSLDCDEPPKDAFAGLVDFRDLLLPPYVSAAVGGTGASPYGDSFWKLYQVLDERVFQSTPDSSDSRDHDRPALSGIVKWLANVGNSSEDGVFRRDGLIFNQITTLELFNVDATLEFSMANATIRNPDSFGSPLVLLKPHEGYSNVLTNNISLGVKRRPFLFEVELSVSIRDGRKYMHSRCPTDILTSVYSSGQLNVRNTLLLTIEFEDLRLQFDFFVNMLADSLSRFPLGDISNHNCWLATLLSPDAKTNTTTRGIGLTGHSFSINEFFFNFDCIDCSSPDFDKLMMELYVPRNAQELEELLAEKSRSLDTVSYIETFLDLVSEESSRFCPHHPNYDSEANSYTKSTSTRQVLNEFLFDGQPKKGIFLLVVAPLCCLLGGWAALFFGRRCLRKDDGEVHAALCDPYEDNFASSAKILNARGRHVFSYVVTCLCLSLLFQILGLRLRLSSIDFDMNIAGQPEIIEEVQVFRFWTCVKGMYNNHGQELAVLVALFGGIVPCIRIVALLAVSCLPKRVLCFKSRSDTLVWFEHAARLSTNGTVGSMLIASMLLVLVGGRSTSLFSSSQINFSLRVVLHIGSGFYCMVLSQLLLTFASTALCQSYQSFKDATESTESQSLNSGHEDEEHRFWKKNLLRCLTILFVLLMWLVLPIINLDLSSLTSAAVQQNDVDANLITQFSVWVVLLGVLQKARFDTGILGWIVLLSFVLCYCYAGFRKIVKAWNNLSEESAFDRISKMWNWCIEFASKEMIKTAIIDKTHETSTPGSVSVSSSPSTEGDFVEAAETPADSISGDSNDEPQDEDEYFYAAEMHQLLQAPYLFQDRWRYSGLLVTMLSIGIFQVVSVTNYAAQLYCNNGQRIFTVLELAGILDETDMSCCYRAQMTNSVTVLACVGISLLMVYRCAREIVSRYKKQTRLVKDHCLA